ncbi:MAG: hypothetical protein H7Z42_21395, partial [Roseiflexaceae bacterium]|nr:hypothetical protein [Roseiflexaceae bacterium]
MWPHILSSRIQRQRRFAKRIIARHVLLRRNAAPATARGRAAPELAVQGLPARWPVQAAQPWPPGEPWTEELVATAQDQLPAFAAPSGDFTAAAEQRWPAPVAAVALSTAAQPRPAPPTTRDVPAALPPQVAHDVASAARGTAVPHDPAVPSSPLRAAQTAASAAAQPLQPSDTLVEAQPQPSSGEPGVWSRLQQVLIADRPSFEHSPRP